MASKRVLVADDDADVCALLAVVLRPIAAVTTVHDAESALTLLASEPPFDAIISDFMLPGITGIEFVRRVRAEPLTSRTPILMISGHDRSSVDASAREAGANAFLNKPFTLVQLRQTISQLLAPSVTFA
ncbi:MAG: response regulator [Candidatus Eremiobacteraeota bacterium]|nr:response regulator [Candidatus Eremiobacteraeota bacterium]